MKIPFNKPYLTGKETDYIREAVNTGKISGNGLFTQKCQTFFEQKYGFRKSLLTTSCTDALEMCAILADIQPGDEVIIPSFTFVSTALAFVRQGARIIFADSLADHPNMNVDIIEPLITSRTKAIVTVHYAGHACNMDALLSLADKYNLLLIEDAAQAIDSYYTSQDGQSRPLGSIGHLAAFSFHETKNIISGEGGMLVINDERYLNRAEIIWEKGTNRASFFRGEVNKYGWVDTGSSFLPSEIVAAFLWAQLEQLDLIQQRRTVIWNLYKEILSVVHAKGYLQLPQLPSYTTNNAHMFYVCCKNVGERTGLIQYLARNSVLAVSHYLSLHASPYYQQKHDGRVLPNTDNFTDCLLRLPLYFELTDADVKLICEHIQHYYLEL